jgi:hypothetical protein
MGAEDVGPSFSDLLMKFKGACSGGTGEDLVSSGAKKTGEKATAPKKRKRDVNKGRGKDRVARRAKGKGSHGNRLRLSKRLKGGESYHPASHMKSADFRSHEMEIICSCSDGDDFVEMTERAGWLVCRLRGGKKKSKKGKTTMKTGTKKPLTKLEARQRANEQRLAAQDKLRAAMLESTKSAPMSGMLSAGAFDGAGRNKRITFDSDSDDNVEGSSNSSSPKSEAAKISPIAKNVETKEGRRARRKAKKEEKKKRKELKRSKKLKVAQKAAANTSLIRGPKISNWMGSDSESSEDDGAAVQTSDAKIISARSLLGNESDSDSGGEKSGDAPDMSQFSRKEFEGKAGHKRFLLQRKIDALTGGDRLVGNLLPRHVLPLCHQPSFAVLP